MFLEIRDCPLDVTLFEESFIMWPLTAAGDTARMSCPFSPGTITRQCSSQGVWLQPDITNCEGLIGTYEYV